MVARAQEAAARLELRAEMWRAGEEAVGEASCARAAYDGGSGRRRSWRRAGGGRAWWSSWRATAARRRAVGRQARPWAVGEVERGW